MTILVRGLENRLTLAFLERNSFRYNLWKYLSPFGIKWQQGSKISSSTIPFLVTWTIEWFDGTSRIQRNKWRHCDKIENLFRLTNVLNSYLQPQHQHLHLCNSQSQNANRMYHHRDILCRTTFRLVWKWWDVTSYTPVFLLDYHLSDMLAQ